MSEKPSPLQWTNKDLIPPSEPFQARTQVEAPQAPSMPSEVAPVTSIAEPRLHPTAEKIISKLDDVETQARKRIASNRGRMNAGLPADTLIDYGIIGGVKIAKGSVKFTVWSADMVKDFGEEIQPHLKEIWVRAKQNHADMSTGKFEETHQTRMSANELKRSALAEKNNATLNGIEPANIKDVGNTEAYTKDIYRIFRKAFGKEPGNNLLKPLDQAKGANASMQEELTNGLHTDIVKGLGISKGSKESALVQRFGEGKITLEELKGLSPKWNNIVKANAWFRVKYNDLIDTINLSRKEIYPNAEKNIAKVDAKIVATKNDTSISATEKSDLLKELDGKREDAMRGKIIPKRADYFRHFQELTDGMAALKNIFDSPANISTQLIGTSEHTLPKAKWLGLGQKRTGDQSAQDAVGGFLNYIPSASYATHIDPQIAKFRELTQAIRDTTEDTHNADTLIGFLDKYTNDLAGKTNKADAFLQDIVPGGRKTFAAVTWLNNRVKSNVILGKAGTLLAQTANVPTGIAWGKKYALPGLIKSVSAIGKPSEAMLQSPFLKERFIDSAYRVFDERLIQQPKKFAVYLLEKADKVGTNFIWNTAYAKGLAEKASDPIRFADMATRDLVAGRGVGEVPLIQKAKTFQLIAPFQLEVGNLWHVQKDMLDAKDFGGLISLYLLNYGYNEIVQKIRGNRVTFDPINAFKQASEPGLTPLQRGGRIAGEVLSNVPLGQTIAANAYPEYGMYGLGSRKQLFGSSDPTRFGSGVLAIKGIQNPLANLVLPWGGGQAEKTIRGVSALNAGGNFSNGKLGYPIETNIPNGIRVPLFGPGASSEAQGYYADKQTPLSVKQTDKAMSSGDISAEYYKTQATRKAAALKAAQKKATAK